MQISDAAKRFNWIKVGNDGVIEFYCDHSMLSALRMCEAYFSLQYLSTPGKRFSVQERNWNLDFGSWIHSTLELFYFHEYKKLKSITSPDPDCYNCNHPKSLHKVHGCLGYNLRPFSNEPLSLGRTHLKENCACTSFVEWNYISKGSFIAHGSKLWTKFQMDYYKDRRIKNYDALGGEIGALAMLSDYYAVYGGGKERLRVVGIELPYGINKEAPIVDYDIFQSDQKRKYAWLLEQKYFFRAFLTGRIDLIVDDGISISPFDHKSTAFFDGSEATKFVPHDGMEGYCYAADKLIRKIYPNKNCNRVLINHLCLQQKDKNDKAHNQVILRPELRFTRSPIQYSPEQLIEYRLRQAASFDVLYQLVINERPAQWNTGSCNNFFHKECIYKPIHGISPAARDTIMRAQYKVIEEWNPFYESKSEII